MDSTTSYLSDGIYLNPGIITSANIQNANNNGLPYTVNTYAGLWARAFQGGAPTANMVPNVGSAWGYHKPISSKFSLGCK